MLDSLSRPSRLTLAAVAVVLACIGAVSAFASTGATPPVVGTPAAGKPLFITRCGVCHVLKVAGTVGTIGENLDKVNLTEATIVKAITNGGAGVMTKAALAKYPTQMMSFKGTLTATQIQNIAAFEYTATHPVKK